MKKLIFALLLTSLINFTTASAETFNECALRVEDEYIKQNTPTQTLQAMCDYYKKPLEECKQIFKNSTEDQRLAIILNFFYNSVVKPKCGEFSETK